jgi:hypothetical protein
VVALVVGARGITRWRRHHTEITISLSGGTMRVVRGVRSLLIGAVLAAALPAVSSAQVAISVSFGPPALPVYEQPPCPEDGYIWTPGYWSYTDDAGYFWVPGTWVPAPTPGYLWTPGYWGWNNGVYVWNSGYWGEHVGFYGGVNYGYGYGGEGYGGGYWNNGHLYYNRSVNNISTTTNITNVYNKTVINNTTTNVSYNGGPGGVSRQPTAAEQAVAHEQHMPPTADQTQHRQEASTNRAQWASQNQGRPAIAATPKPGAFTGKGVVMASKAGAPYHAPANSPQAKAAGGAKPATAARPAGGSPPAAHPAGAVAPKTNAPPAKTPPPKATQPEARPQGQQPAAKPQGQQPQAKPQAANQPKPAAKPQGNPKPEEKPKEAPKPEEHHDQGDKPNG